MVSLFLVPIVAVSYLLDRSTSSSFLMRGDRPTPFCIFPPHTVIRSLTSFGNSPWISTFWSQALRQLPERFSWSCLGFLTLFFILAFLCLPPLLSLYLPVLVWLLILFEDVGVWPACVSSPIFLNLPPGRLLVGFLLPFSLLGGRSLFLRVSWSCFLLSWLGFWLGYLYRFFVNDQGFDWAFASIFVNV